MGSWQPGPTPTDGDDVYEGDSSNEVVVAGAGNDQVFGRDGDDTIDGGSGDDILDGGAGVDTATYANATAGVWVYLNNAASQNTGGAGWDRLIDIENLIGSSFTDVLVGNSIANDIRGGVGDDVVEGGLGNDILDGGDGVDTISFLASGSGVTVDLRLTTAQQTGAGLDTISNFENIAGSQFKDRLMGDAKDNTFLPANGNDYIDGGEGVDSVIFGFSSHSATVARFGDVLGVGGPAFTGIDHLTSIEKLSFSDGTFSPDFFPEFDIYGYLSSNKDIYTAFGSDTAAAMLHYVNYGFDEKRVTNNFDALRYIAGYDDLVLGLTPDRATEHFIRYGLSEGRLPDVFDPYQYLASNLDIVAEIGVDGAKATKHFVEEGLTEGRSRDTFDALGYLASNADLIDAFGANEAAAAEHFLVYGRYESGRMFNFDALQYIASYGDLINGLGVDAEAGKLHYIEHGYREGRPQDSFDATQYLENYADLRNAFGSDEAAATAHYIAYGYNEGRIFWIAGSPSPDSAPAESEGPSPMESSSSDWMI